MAGMGIPRFVIGEILNPVDPGVTKVYDRCAYDRDKQEALNIWGGRLAKIVSGPLRDKSAALERAAPPHFCELSPPRNFSFDTSISRL